jgi:hypothetical protein
MSLEEMTKPELVKRARSVEQELKLVTRELEELKAKVESSTKATDDAELPYKAFSMITFTNTLSKVVPITFDLKGNAKVHLEDIKVSNAPYKAAHLMNKLVTLEVETQKAKVEPKVEEK